MSRVIAAKETKVGGQRRKRRIPEGKILKTLYLDVPVVEFVKTIGISEKRTFTGQVSHILEEWSKRKGLRKQ